MKFITFCPDCSREHEIGISCPCHNTNVLPRSKKTSLKSELERLAKAGHTIEISCSYDSISGITYGITINGNKIQKFYTSKPVAYLRSIK